MSNLTFLNYSYTCTYFLVSTPNPLAATLLRNFLLFREIILFCFVGSEPAFVVFVLLSLFLVFRFLEHI